MKTEAERATPNAILHETIAKIPDSVHPDFATMMIQKRKYEDDLYKTEMVGTPPPWGLNELIDYIAVDLAPSCSPVE